MCPLCHEAIPDYAGNICIYCSAKFKAEKEAAQKRPGVLPEAILNSEGLSAGGYYAWLAGKCEQLGAIYSGKSDDEAKAIGHAKMEKEAKREREGLARQQARIARERAAMNRLFRHG